MERWLGRIVKRIGGKPWFAAVGKRIMPPLDRAVHKATKGKVQLSGRVLPTLMLLHRGRKSGTAYQTPLAYLPDDERFVLVGSNWGQTHHPAWTYNLLADPDVAVETKGRHVEVRARLVEGDEREAYWERLLALWPAYETYIERAGDREIRLFVLEPR